MAIEAVIFDCDGTLVDSERLSLRVLVGFVAEFGLGIPLDEAVTNWAGGELPVVIAEIESRLGRPLPANFLQQFRLRQLALLGQEVEAIHGADRLLNEMTKPFCVASNAPRNKVELCLRTSKLDHHFEEELIFSAYEIDAWKPEPDLFLLAAERLGVAPERCAVVEDSRFGIEAGIAAGMQVFEFDPHGKLAAAEPEGPNYRVQCLLSLLPLLT